MLNSFARWCAVSDEKSFTLRHSITSYLALTLIPIHKPLTRQYALSEASISSFRISRSDDDTCRATRVIPAVVQAAPVLWDRCSSDLLVVRNKRWLSAVVLTGTASNEIATSEWHSLRNQKTSSLWNALMYIVANNVASGWRPSCGFLLTAGGQHTLWKEFCGGRLPLTERTSGGSQTLSLVLIRAVLRWR